MAKKLYYKIGEVAKMFNVNTSLIRYWEQEFDFIKPKKSKGGIRRFTQKDIDHFEIIHHLVKEKGLTIQGAKDYISKRSESELDKLEVINTLKKTKKFLKDIKEILEMRNPEDVE
jgi:DNA-binding transcriptional MerR regulator